MQNATDLAKHPYADNSTETSENEEATDSLGGPVVQSEKMLG